jgi:hypothetical protein
MPVGVDLLVHNFPPSVVVRIPSPPTAAQKLRDEHETLVSHPVVFFLIIQVFPPLVETAIEKVASVCVSKSSNVVPTATHLLADGHEIDVHVPYVFGS